MLLWVLASQVDNRIPYDLAFITRKLGAQQAVDIEELVLQGFIEVFDDDSVALAPRKQMNRPETETETEGEKKPRGKRALVPTVDEERVLAHYRTTHPMRRPGERDLRAIRAALKRGYGPEELCAAIDGNAADEWHRDRHKHELPYVLREGKIDDFREAMATANQPLVDPETGLLNDHGSRRLGLTRTH
jgi:hypothetical protein